MCIFARTKQGLLTSYSWTLPMPAPTTALGRFTAHSAATRRARPTFGMYTAVPHACGRLMSRFLLKLLQSSLYSNLLLITVSREVMSLNGRNADALFNLGTLYIQANKLVPRSCSPFRSVQHKPQPLFFCVSFRSLPSRTRSEVAIMMIVHGTHNNLRDTSGISRMAERG